MSHFPAGICWEVYSAQRIPPRGETLPGSVDYNDRVDILIRIKRLVIARRVEFTAKATEERLRDGLAIEDVMESVVNANAIKKVLRSRSPGRQQRNERLYVIESPTFTGVWVYTKRTIRRKGGSEVFYVFVSSKLSV